MASKRRREAFPFIANPFPSSHSEIARPQASEGSIDLGFERAEETDGRLVVEGKDLGEEDAAHALRPVDPEVGVGEPGPGEAAGGAAGGRLLRVDEEAQSP